MTINWQSKTSLSNCYYHKKTMT